MNSLAVDFYRISVIRNGSSHVAKKVTNSSIKKTKFGEKIDYCFGNKIKIRCFFRWIERKLHKILTPFLWVLNEMISVLNDFQWTCTSHKNTYHVGMRNHSHRIQWRHVASFEVFWIRIKKGFGIFILFLGGAIREQ